MSATLKLARAFVAVAASGSFTRAADALHITQPALTVQIKQLEQSLNVPLFERTTRSVALTPAGRKLAAEFRDLLAAWDTLIANAHELAGTTTETLRIGCLPSLAGTILPDLISEFSAAHPNVEVIVRDVVLERLLGILRSGEVDIAIGSDRGVLPDLEVTPLTAEPMFVVFPPGHPLEALDRIGIEDVVRYPLVLVGNHSSFRRSIEAALSSTTSFAYPVKEVTYSAAAVGLVRAGFGVTVLPSASMELRARTGMSTRRIDDCFRHLVLLRRSGVLSSGASAAFAALALARTEAVLLPLSEELDAWSATHGPGGV